jgi:lipopolysaccharide transport system permease protein
VILGVFPPLAVLISFAIGFGIFLGVINVFYRDVSQTMRVVLQFWFWLTPIVYVDVPDAARIFLKLNPIFPIVDAMHRIFVYESFPEWGSLLYPALLSVVMLFLGMYAFWKLHGEIVDEL